MYPVSGYYIKNMPPPAPTKLLLLPVSGQGKGKRRLHPTQRLIGRQAACSGDIMRRDVGHSVSLSVSSDQRLSPLIYLSTIIFTVHQDFTRMDRKTVVCHICGVETKRFGDHVASAHARRDFKKEKVSVLYFLPKNK